MRARLGVIAAVALAGLGVLVGCSSGSAPDGTQSTAGGRGHTMSLTQILARVPASVAMVDFTHWAAVGELTDAARAGAFTQEWLRDAATFPKTVGVGVTDEAWQVDVPMPDGRREILTQWPDPHQLDSIVAALTRHGWVRSGRGAVFTLNRRTPLADDGWHWAFEMEFAVDETVGLLTEYRHGQHPLVPGTQPLGTAPAVRRLVRSGSDLVSGRIRVGAKACAFYGLLSRNPPVTVAIARHYARAVAGLGRIDGVEFGATSPAFTAGRAVVLLPDASQAQAELARRSAALGLLPGGDGGVSVASSRVDGSSELLTLRHRAPGAPLELTHWPDLDAASYLGFDSCGLN